MAPRSLRFHKQLVVELLVLGTQNVETGKGKVQLRELASGAVRAEFSGHDGPVSSLALSADGRVLASGSNDTTVILWDLTGLKQRSPGRLSVQDAEALGLELGDEDARQAYQVMWRMAAAPRESVTVLAGKLKPETDPNASDIARLIGQMDDARFAVRERAVQALRGVGEPALASLKRALAGQPSREIRTRLEGLLADLDSGRRLAGRGDA